MTLTKATACAERLGQLIKPLSVRIEVAGSVRRKRAECNDIDLIVIPKYEEIKDIFGVVVQRNNLAAQFLSQHASLNHWTVLVNGDDVFRFYFKGVFADVFWCNEQTWVSSLICRTGSMRHNIQISQRAQSLGMYWTPNHSLRMLSNSYVRTSSEAEFYAALKLPYIAPEDREDISRIIIEANRK